MHLWPCRNRFRSTLVFVVACLVVLGPAVPGSGGEMEDTSSPEVYRQGSPPAQGVGPVSLEDVSGDCGQDGLLSTEAASLEAPAAGTMVGEWDLRNEVSPAAACTEGQLMFIATGGCCGAFPRNEFERWECQGGVFVFTGYRCFGACL